MTTNAITFRLDGKPLRPNCNGLYPSTLREGLRDYFANHVKRPVDIGMDEPSRAGPVQAALNAFATKTGFLFSLRIVVKGAACEPLVLRELVLQRRPLFVILLSAFLIVF